MTPKDALSLLPAGVRGVFYTIFALTGVVFGGIQVGYGAVELAQPAWLTVALAVYAFVGGAFGLVAVTHTDETPPVDAHQVAAELAAIPQEFAMPEGDLYAGAQIEAVEAIEEEEVDLPDLEFPDYSPRH